MSITRNKLIIKQIITYSKINKSIKEIIDFTNLTFYLSMIHMSR